MGFGASDEDIARAHGINVNLSVGIALLIIAACFIAWALWRPLGRELEDAEAEGSGDDDERRFEKGDRSPARPAQVPEKQ
jgi:hypothetical protein